MTYFASCFLVGLLATLFIMRWSIRYGHLSADHDLSGPQKFHGRPVPCVGGAGIMAAIVAGAVIAQVNESPAANPLWLLIACSLPAFVAGITEDLTKKVSPRRRLFAPRPHRSLQDARVADFLPAPVAAHPPSSASLSDAMDASA